MYLSVVPRTYWSVVASATLVDANREIYWLRMSRRHRKNQLQTNHCYRAIIAGLDVCDKAAVACDVLGDGGTTHEGTFADGWRARPVAGGC
jgi:hypothetical protein